VEKYALIIPQQEGGNTIRKEMGENGTNQNPLLHRGLVAYFVNLYSTWWISIANRMIVC